jgi:hypothetical protein
MAEFIESDLKFTFDDDSWSHVIKFDERESSIYKQMKDNLEGSKAVDFVGIKDEKTLYFIEVKNQRNGNEQIEGEYQKLNDVEQKVRDSLALIIGINCTDNFSEDFKAYKRLLCCDKPNIKVILWNENDWVKVSKRQQRKNNTLTRQLKEKFSWLTELVDIDNTEQYDSQSYGFTVATD